MSRQILDFIKHPEDSIKPDMLSDVSTEKGLYYVVTSEEDGTCFMRIGAQKREGQDWSNQVGPGHSMDAGLAEQDLIDYIINNIAGKRVAASCQ